MTTTGCVSRWFNRKGYGFINVISSDSEHVGKDLFVHLSGINIKNDSYKSLYPGEYVSFDIDKANDGRFTCVNLTGIYGGSLLVEHPDYRYRCIRKDNESVATETATATTKEVAKETETVVEVATEVVTEVVTDTVAEVSQE